MNGVDTTITIHTRSLFWFIAGIATALIAAAVLVGARATAAPGPGEATFVPITPCRLVDTRPAPSLNTGPRNTPLGAGETHEQQVTGTNGDCTIPSTATGVSLNVTAVNPTAPSFMTIFPFGAALPDSSNLNYLPGTAPTPNKVDVKLSSDGKIGVYNLAGTVHLVADVGGYYTTVGLQDLQQQIRTQHVFAAEVFATGTKVATGPYTSSRTSVGNYSIQFDVGKYRIFASPNAATTYDPVPVASVQCQGYTVTTSRSGSSIDADRFYKSFTVTVKTRTGAGVSADCRFTVLVTVADPTPLVIGTLPFP